MRKASWNKRAKYYVILEDGKRGIQDRTEVGQPAPSDCRLVNCNGNEHIEYAEKKRAKKKDSVQGSGISSTVEPNKEMGSKSEVSEKEIFNSSEKSEKDDTSESWFSSVLGW